MMVPELEYEGPIPRYIIELDAKQCKLMAGLAQAYLRDNPKDEIGVGLLANLKEQTDVVYSDLKLMGIYKNKLEAPENAVKINGFYYIPIK